MTETNNPEISKSSFKPKQQKMSNAWMITFADLLSLMLTFFVLSYSMSVIIPQQWTMIKDSLSQRFKPLVQNEVTDFIEDLTVDRNDNQRLSNTAYIAELLKWRIKTVEELKDIEIYNLKNRILIKLPITTHFEANSHEASKEADKILYTLAETLNHFSNRLELWGNTDTLPPSKNYRSNWELSLLRSISFAELLTKYGYQRDISVLGVADSQFDSIINKNDLTSDEKKKISRRVDIIINNFAENK